MQATTNMSKNISLPLPRMSRVVMQAKESVIPKILGLAARPGIISFAGGLPTPAGFPIKAIQDAANWVLAHDAGHALQYSIPKGEAALREKIAAWETRKGTPTTPEEIRIVTGSQQAIDLIARAFLDPGAKVGIERPTYLGALSAFNLLQPEYVDLPCDKEGLNPEAMDTRFAECRFLYVMPTFNNPTGLTINEARRRLLAQKARELNVWIIEDDPYGELWYDHEPPQPIRSFAPERTLRLGTFSKILSPGFRCGYIAGPENVLQAITTFKQSNDVHTSTFVQEIVERIMSEEVLRDHLPYVRSLYHQQAADMLAALKRCMPNNPLITWTRPEGGMFIWVKLPDYINTTKLLEEAVQAGIAFVPGEACYAQNPDTSTLRLSFVTVPKEQIDKGVAILGELVARHLH